MSKTIKNDNRLIYEADILDSYVTGGSPLIGSEIEHFVLRPDGKLISPETRNALVSVLAKNDVKSSEEPLASIFELKSSPHRSGLVLMDEMSGKNQQFLDIIRKSGFMPVQKGYLGNITLPEAMACRIPSERADMLLEHFIENGHDLCARQPIMTASVHVSISYSDIDHAYSVAKLLMTLTPPLTALCENAGPLFDGIKCGFNQSATIRLSQRSGRGGLSPCIPAAANPQDMMRLQAHHVFNTPMMMHLDDRNKMQITDETGEHPSLAVLARRGQNTVSNALLSESMQYHFLKFTSLRDEQGRATGKRLELRMADNGPFQHDFLVMLSDAITFDSHFRKELADMLTACGLPPFETTTGYSAVRALNAVAADRDNAMRLPYGAVTIGEICRKLCAALDEKFRSNPVLKMAGKNLCARL